MPPKRTREPSNLASVLGLHGIFAVGQEENIAFLRILIKCGLIFLAFEKIGGINPLTII